MRKIIITIGVTLALLLMPCLHECTAGQKIKVGVYNFNPLVFINDNGTASGFFPDILNHIADMEDWEISYIQGSWSECLSRIENGEIDLQVAIAYTAKRAEQLDFSDYLILDWATVFKQKQSPIQTIFDLQDKTISVVKSGITTDEFKRVLAQFGITCNLLEKRENSENLKAIHDKEADAGVCPNIYGTMVENNYDIERTTIVFSPIKLGFATKKGHNNRVITTINKHISEFKADKESIYYNLRDKWTGYYGKPNMLSQKLLNWLLILVGFTVILVIFNIILNKRIKIKTSELVSANNKLQISEENYRNLFEQATEELKERKLAEAALRESEEKFRVVFEQAPIGIILSDGKGIVLDCNKYLADIFGAKVENYYGMNLLEKLPDGPVRQNLVNALNDFEIHSYEGQYISIITGKQLYMNVISERVNPNFMITIVIDLTQNRESEQEKQKLQQQLLQSQKMESIGRLAGGVAHDFNNMLGVIVGHVELLLTDTDFNESSRNGLIAIQNAANRSVDLTKQLLAFARRQTISPNVVDLNQAIEKTLSMLVRLIGEDIELLWRAKDNQVKTVIDPAQIDQILFNLCINARDAIIEKSNPDNDKHGDDEINRDKNDNDDKRGKITIETGSAFFDEEYCKDNIEAIPGSYASLAVSDNGCGIKKEILQMIFDPFFTTKETNKGTGLGLSSVYGIVKQNSGFISVYSELGKGTTFRVYLPKYDLEHDTTDETEAYSNEESFVIGHETILMVEDEEWLLELGETMLKRIGYNVVVAGSPKEAIETVQNYSGEIDLLITDVIMPEMNGRELQKQILNIRPTIKCLFMSGYTANVIAHHGVLDNGVHFIQKPFSIQELSKKIREALDS